MERAGFAARSCGNSRLLSVARRNYSVSFHQPPKSMSPMLPFVACSAECTYDVDGAGGVNNIGPRSQSYV